MHSIPSSTTGARRSSWLLVVAAVIVVGCGGSPSSPSTGGGTDTGGGAGGGTGGTGGGTGGGAGGGGTGAVPTVDGAFTCTTTSRTKAKLQTKGSLAGAEPLTVQVTVLATGATLAEAATPVLDAAFDNGRWATSYGMDPWDISGGAPGGTHLVMPRQVAAAFSAYLVELSPSGSAIIQAMACDRAAPPLTPPSTAPLGPTLRTLACASPAMGVEAIAVTGGLDLLSRPRDVAVTLSASGASTVSNAAPAYDPAFDGGAWEIGSRLQAWALGVGTDATTTLLLPGAPLPEAFDAIVIKDFPAGDRVEISISCSAR